MVDDEDKIEDLIEDSEESAESDLIEEVADEIEDEIEQFKEEGFVSDFSIGNIGLATAKVQSAWRGSQLEEVLDDIPVNEWEERDEEDSLDMRAAYGENSDGDVYGEIGRGDGAYGLNDSSKMYSGVGGGYESNLSEGLYDIKEDKGERKLWSNERLPGSVSRLERDSMKRIDGVFAEGFKKKGADKKYHVGG